MTAAATTTDVLVVTAAGSERTGKLLANELELLGFTTNVRTGAEEAAIAAHARSEQRAVVWLDEREGANIWLEGDESNRAPQHVANSSSSELLALRTAELLRGRLLSGEDPAASSAEPLEGDEHLADASRFVLFGGPGVIASSYAEPLPSFSLGFMYRAWERVRVGGFGSGSMARNRWISSPEHLFTSQLSLGARLAVRWLDPPSKRFHSDLLFRSTVRGLQVRSEDGGPMEKGTANIWGPTFDLGVDGSYELTPWFGLALETCFIVGVPLGRTVTRDNGMALDPAAPVVVATENLGADFQVVTSFLAVANW